MKPQYAYNAFGLNIISEIEIPELQISNFNKTDVRILYGKNPRKLENYKDYGVLYQAKKNDFLLRLETVGSYRVQNGSMITVEPLNNSTDEEIRLFLLGSAFGALIHQRGLFPLHGSTIIHNKKAYSICGHSGAGKSTLAAALQKKGYKILADDITAISIQSNTVIAYPGIPQLKLWEDVIKQLNENPDDYQRVRPQLKKYRKSAISLEPLHSTKIEKIVLLVSNNKSLFNVEKIKGAEKFNIIRNNTYRSQFISGLDTAEQHFKLASKLASAIDIFKIERPNTPLLIDELADYFIKNILQPK